MTKNYKNLLRLELFLYIFIIIFALYFKSTTPDYYKWVLEHYRDNMFVFPTVLDRFLVGVQLFNFNETPWSFELMVKNGIMNIVVFLPFGALVYLLSDKKRFLRAVNASFSFSLFIEIVQLVTVIGGFGIKDIIANVIGGLLGACIMALISIIHLAEKHKKALMIGMILVTAFVLAYFMRNALMHIDVYIGILTRSI